jgi:glycosyltransferase involved in cell wall biosynthesis
MTASAEAHAPGGHGPGGSGLGRGWREAAQAAQNAALPSGSAVVSCSAPLGSGGLGRHLQELCEAFARGGSEVRCISASSRAAEPGGEPRHGPGIPYLASVLRAMPMLPSSPGVRARAAMIEFDRYAAARLAGAEHLLAFNGQALAQFAAARRAGLSSWSLVSANPHLRRLARQHGLARRSYPLEGSWATRLLERNLAEYEQADRIYYASEYVRSSFIEEGAPEESLVRFPLTPDPRYAPGAREPAPRFEIVFVGSLSVHKGVPLLIDAVRRLPDLDLGLRLVGGWGTPGMRRFVERARVADGRIAVCPGDPLPHLRQASLCVHPAYEDGFSYAPAEALAAGVPVIVSEDTGMNELITPGRDGLVLPTGDLGALVEAIEAAYRGEAFTMAGAGDG